MGTYIYIHGHISYDKDKENDIVQALKDLNKRNDLKNGGSSNGQKWFSWMNENYDEYLSSVEEMLTELGFESSMEIDTDTKEVRYDLHYNDKWGQHELFFIAMAPHLNSMQIYHECDELSNIKEYWILELDPKTKEVKQRQAEVIIKYPPMDESLVVTFKDYTPWKYDFSDEV